MADNTVDGFHTRNVPGDFTGFPPVPEPVYTLYPGAKRLSFLAVDNPNSSTGISYYSAGAVTSGKAYFEYVLNDIQRPQQGTVFGIMIHNDGPEALEFGSGLVRSAVKFYELSGSGGYNTGTLYNRPLGTSYESLSLIPSNYNGAEWADGARLGIAIDADARTVRAFMDDIEFTLPAFVWTPAAEVRMFISGRYKFDVSILTTAEDLAGSATFAMLEAEGYTPWVYVPPPPPIDCCPPLPQRTDPGCGTTSCGREFSEKTLSWSDSVKTDGEYTFPESRLNPVETVLVTAPVGRNNEDYRLTMGSVLWAPLTIAAVEWTGQYFNNARRT